MKNLPCLIFLAAIASLILLAAASFLGLPFPLLHVASIVTGFFGAAGVLALFLVDYRPRRAYDDPVVSPAEAKREIAPAMPAAFNLRRIVRPHQRTGRPVSGGALATLGLNNNPATLSLL
jgi:hypothetical protein